MRRILLLSIGIATVFAVQALAEEPAPSDDDARRAKVIATVGVETITVGEIEDLLNARSPYARKRFDNPQILKDFVEDQVQNSLFYQGAQKLGYGDDPQVVQFVDQTMIQLFFRKEFEEKVTPEDIADEDVAKYYEEHAEDFRQPEMRRARHILVGSPQEAQEMLERLATDDSASFRALAKQMSLDTETNMRGGDLLYFTEDGKLVGKEGETVDPTLAKAAFGLAKTGDRSAPLDLGDGQWSVLELTGIRPENVRTLEQASAWIRRRIWRDRHEAALEALVAELRAELKPEVYPERMGAIVLEPSKQPIEPPNQ